MESTSSKSLFLNKSLEILLFAVPFIFSALNLQGFLHFLVSSTLSQVFAYLVLALVLFGAIMKFKKNRAFKFNLIIKLWYLFFIFYYLFATFASGFGDEKYSLLKTLVAPIYFIGFSYYFVDKKKFKLFTPYITWTFFIGILLSIYLNYINFSFDYDGIAEYKIERSAGIYGDANNSSLASVLCFIFIFYTFYASNKILKAIKLICLLICTYGIVITYSTTGFLAFTITLFLIALQRISMVKLLIGVLIAPVLIISAYNFIISSNALSISQRDKIENFANLITFNTEEVNYSDRDRRFGTLLDAIENSPFIGNGLLYGNEVLYSHNTIFNVWADAGLMVFIIFIILLFTYYYKILHISSHKRYFALSIIMVISLFMLTLQTIINQAYLITVFVFLAYYIYNNLDNHQSNHVSA